jgi:copper chaperone
MKTIRFRTNIPNNEAAKTLKPHLDNLNGIVDWNINTDVPGKVLLVKINGITSKLVAQTIFKAGFRSEEIVPVWKKVFKKTFSRDCCS